MASDHPLWPSNLADSDRYRGVRRPAHVVGLSLSVAGLILGTTYGGPIAPVTVFLAVLLGGVLYREALAVLGSEVYGNVLLGLFFGTILSSLSISVLLSLALGVPVIGAIWATSINILSNAVLIATMGLFGFVAVPFVSILRLSGRDRVALPLLGIGTAAFITVEYLKRVARDGPGVQQGTLGNVAAAFAGLPLRVAGIVAAAVGFVGFVAAIDSPDRRRVAMAGTILLSVAAGAAGLGTVGTQVGLAYTAASVSDRADVTVTGVDASGDDLELSLELSNPTGTPVKLTGLYVQVATQEESQLAYGAGQRVDDGPAVIRPGETITARYHVGMSPAQAERVREALDRGTVTVVGRTRLHLTDTGPLPGARNTGLTVRFNCVIDGDRISC